MKYYIYISDSKVSMLHQQIAQTGKRNRESSLGFDVKLLRGHIKETHGLPENSITRLDKVVHELNTSGLVGSVEHPKEYLGGVLPMTWCTYGYEKPAITVWGFSEESDHPFSGTVMALVGSQHNLLGQQYGGLTDSGSLTPQMTQWFIDNLEEPIEDDDVRKKDRERFGPMRNEVDDVPLGAWLAATQAEGTRGQYEFVAKLLHKSEWPEGVFCKTKRIILASPLYVAYSE